jgi:hypothetical protein
MRSAHFALRLAFAITAAVRGSVRRPLCHQGCDCNSRRREPLVSEFFGGVEIWYSGKLIRTVSSKLPSLPEVKWFRETDGIFSNFA